jgi:hypothetical protein
MIGLQSNKVIKQKERGWQMSANVYTIENLLVGKTYRSNSLTGEIISAKKHPYAVWYQDCESYLVEVRPHYSKPLALKDTYRTVAVKVGE